MKAFNIGRRAQFAHEAGVARPAGPSGDSPATLSKPTPSRALRLAGAWRTLPGVRWTPDTRWVLSLEGQRRLAWALTIALVLIDMLVIGQRVLVRHFAFHSYAFDLGNMDQAVWNTLHGHPFRFTNRGVDWYGPPTRLAIHVEPILLLIAPLYLIHSGPSTLLVLQTVALALGAVPLLALSLRRLPDLPLLGVVFVAAYLLTPELLGEAFYDFHPVTLATPLLLAAVYFLDARRYGWFLVAGALAASTKEDVALALVPLGLLIALRHGRPRLGLLLAVGSVAWTALCFLVIMPHYNAGVSSGGNAFWYRYSALGGSPATALRHLATHPLLAASILFNPDKLGYLALLARTGGGLGILAPFWWLVGLPELAINLLSSQQAQYSGFYQYNAMLLPSLLIAAVYGTAALRAARLAATGAGTQAATPMASHTAGRLGAWLDSIERRWTRLLGRLPIASRLIGPLAAAWLVVTLVLNMLTIQPKLQGFWNGGARPAPYQAQINALLRRIPPSATVAATDTLDPHLSDRETIYLLPDPESYQAQYVAVDLTTVPAPWQSADIAMFSSMAASHRYRVLGVAGPVEVLQRVGPPLVGG